MHGFELTCHLKVSPAQAYEAWLSSELHRDMTGGPRAQIDPRKGGAFTAWDGFISGVTMDLTPGSRILQRWRTTDFDEHQGDSRLEILFEADGEGTLLRLRHSEIPGDLAEDLKQGWQDFYFNPMKEYFGQ